MVSFKLFAGGGSQLAGESRWFSTRKIGGVVNLVVKFQIFLMFTPTKGEMIQFDDHICQKGWFSHQLDKVVNAF